MSDPFSLNARGVGGYYESNAIVRTWVDRIKIMGIDPFAINIGFDSTVIENNFLYESASIQPIPSVGDYHPTYADCCCANIRVVPMPTTEGEAPTGVHVDVTWIQARRDPAGDRARQVIVVPYQSQEIRNFDTLGTLTRVFYNSGTENDPRFPPCRIADIRVPRTMHHFKIVQYEDMKDRTIGDFTQTTEDDDNLLKLPVYNTEAWCSCKANTLLLIGRHVQYEGIPIARVEYSFMTNDRGWNKFFAVYTQQNGYVPKDLDDLPDDALDPDTEASEITQNGIGCFDMLDAAAFAEILPEIADKGLNT